MIDKHQLKHYVKAMTRIRPAPYFRFFKPRGKPVAQGQPG
jgi:hypothetical protein